jgi:hypothetical protein
MQALITAEAAVRIATRKFAPGSQANLSTPGVGGKPDAVIRTDGAVWWLNRELEEQQAKYGPKKK